MLRALLLIYGECNALVLDSVLELAAEPRRVLDTETAKALGALTVGLRAALEQAAPSRTRELPRAADVPAFDGVG